MVCTCWVSWAFARSSRRLWALTSVTSRTTSTLPSERPERSTSAEPRTSSTAGPPSSDTLTSLEPWPVPAMTGPRMSCAGTPTVSVSPGRIRRTRATAAGFRSRTRPTGLSAMIASPICSMMSARATGVKVNRCCRNTAYAVTIPVTASPTGVGSMSTGRPPAMLTTLTARGTSTATSTLRRCARKAGGASQQAYATTAIPTASAA